MHTIDRYIDIYSILYPLDIISWLNSLIQLHSQEVASSPPKPGTPRRGQHSKSSAIVASPPKPNKGAHLFGSLTRQKTI